jgi:hypothetical protein
LLAGILRKNCETEFGLRHGFGAIDSFRTFQQRVPISQYEDLEPYIRAAMAERPNQLTKSPPILFTTTSGTTGRRKYIPMTAESRRLKAKVMRLWLAAFYRDHPTLAAGKLLSVVSPEIESRTSKGIPCGSESGHAYRTMPRIVRSMYATPYAVFTIDDYEAKYYTLLRLAAEQDIRCIVTVNPSTIVMLGDRLADHTESIIRDVWNGTLSADFAVPSHIRGSLTLRPNRQRALQVERAAALGQGVLRPRFLWPNFTAIGCWKGGTVGSYLDRFDTYFDPRTPVRDLGYLATELRGSVPLADEGEAGALAIGTNVLEFHPADDDRRPEGSNLLKVEDLDVGRRYFVFVTTSSGLYRYDMNDIIEVVGMAGRTPLIRFVQKGRGVVSFTGEKLYEVQVIGAVDAALSELRGRYHFISAVAEVPTRTVVPRLTFLIEFDSEVTDVEGSALVDRLDAELARQNSEYAAKRKSLRYDPPVIKAVRAGEFDDYRRRMVQAGRSDGQFKMLRLTTDASLVAEFRSDREFVGAGSVLVGIN